MGERNAVSLIGKRVGNYVIEEKLGSGGMGEVYVARHPQIGKRVAVKILKASLQRDQDAVARFFQEAKAVAELSHAGIVEAFDFGMVDDVAYLTMELLHGEDLATRIVINGLRPRTLDGSSSNAAWRCRRSTRKESFTAI